jgi:hypothetical protein
MIPVETIPGKGDGGNKGEQWIGLNSSMIYVWYIVRIFVNAAMYPHPAQWKKSLHKNQLLIKRKRKLRSEYSILLLKLACNYIQHYMQQVPNKSMGVKD